ncbi:NAD(P)-binding protein [Aulographum hederae CBS 113979]|uniref:Probable quinone oxidoreductase n=1 Tax=Aulographum hederae CBS 113979 TaxID=1176131 RepID=A0A6G1GW24_9PEZI|nr:NAD(P)-binding protein [Aulographum hederae CBS 113979]
MSLTARQLPQLARRTAVSRLSHLSSHLNISPLRAPFSSKSYAMAPLPSTVAAVQIGKTGGIEVLEYKTDVPVPKPKEGEVLVKNEYIGVNYIDTYFRSGLYPAPSFPYTLGREASGVVTAVGSGNVHNLTVGDRVAYLSTSAYASYTAAPALHTIKIPDEISTQDAAAALLQGLTALTMIREGHHVRKGDFILVHAAAGGVGLWLCQLLRSVGARVIATASTKEKLDLAKKNGAEFLVNYSHEDVKEAVMKHTNGAGCIAVLDGVGKSTFDQSLECVARKGTMVSYGNASGAVPPVTIARLSGKNVKLLRPTLFNYITTRDEFETYSNELFQFVSRDKLDVRVHEVYPLSESARAQEDLEARKTTGKLLLKP